MNCMSVSHDPPVVKSIPKFCGKWSWFNVLDGSAAVFRCGQPRCPNEACRKHAWSERVKLVAALIEEHKLNVFFTLTWSRELPKEVLWECAAATWDVFAHKMRRRVIGWKYVTVLEEHKDGYPHLHGFTDLHMDQADWSRLWESAGGGRITWVEAVKTGDVADYASKQLAKYIGKQQLTGAVAHLPKRRRTMWRSSIKAKFELEAKEDKGWMLVREKLLDKDGNTCYTVVDYGERYEARGARWLRAVVREYEGRQAAFRDFWREMQS